MKLILRESSPLSPLTDLWLVYYASALFSPTYYIDKGYSQFDAYLVGGGAGGGSGGWGSTVGSTASGGGGGGGGDAHFEKGLLLAGVDIGSAITVGAGGAGGVYDFDYDSYPADGPDSVGEAFKGSPGGETSFLTMHAFGGSGGGGGANTDIHLAPGASGGAGGGALTNNAPGQWKHTTTPIGGAGIAGGGSGANASTPDTSVSINLGPGLPDPVLPGSAGAAYGTKDFGGGGGGAGAPGSTLNDFQFTYHSRRGSLGGAGYHTAGGQDSIATGDAVSHSIYIEPASHIVTSAGGGGGGGVDLNFVTGHGGLISSLFIPGQGGQGGTGYAYTHATDTPTGNGVGQAGSPGCVVLRIYI